MKKSKIQPGVMVQTKIGREGAALMKVIGFSEHVTDAGERLVALVRATGRVGTHYRRVKHLRAVGNR